MSIPLFLYVLILFAGGLITSNSYGLELAFCFCFLLLPVHAIILGAAAGRNIRRRWFFPAIPPVLLGLNWKGRPNYMDSLDTFGAYLVKRIIYFIAEKLGIELSVSDDAPLFLYTAAFLLVLGIISMLISALLHREKSAD